MAFLFGEKRTTVGDNESEVAGVRLIKPGKIDLIENAMTQREPKPALEAQRSAYAGLGARSPAGFDSGPARRITKIIAQRSPSSSVPEDVDLCSGSTDDVGRRI